QDTPAQDTPAQDTPAQDTASTACGSLPVISEACEQLIDAASWALDCGLGGVGECAGDITETVVAGAFDYFARWVAVGAIGAIDLVWVGIDGTTTPVIDSSSTVFQTSLVAARALALPLLVLAALYSLLKRDAGIALKAAFIYLPGSVLGMVAAGYIITALLAATDEFSGAYLDDGQSSVAVWLDDLGGLIAAGVGITAPILLVVFSFVLIAGSILVWLVMVVRAAAILITYAFMPLAFAAIIFPATRSWIKRLIEIQLSFILAKPVIVAVLALGSQTLNDADNALVGMIQAAALFFLAAFSPFALMKLLPFVGDEAVAAMEQPSRAPASRVASIAIGVVSGQRLAGFLAGSQQEGPSTAASVGGGPVGTGGSPSSAGGEGGGPPPPPGGSGGGSGPSSGPGGDQTPGGGSSGGRSAPGGGSGGTPGGERPAGGGGGGGDGSGGTPPPPSRPPRDRG
ncbi:MAG: hypothetical protein OEV40_24095, partial [Acidimicrobiia bacterium]|nr:hypothetical protein [Acidimicrobiia bacterium]